MPSTSLSWNGYSNVWEVQLPPPTTSATVDPHQRSYTLDPYQLWYDMYLNQPSSVLKFEDVYTTQSQGSSKLEVDCSIDVDGSINIDTNGSVGINGGTVDIFCKKPVPVEHINVEVTCDYQKTESLEQELREAVDGYVSDLKNDSSNEGEKEEEQEVSLKESEYNALLEEVSSLRKRCDVLQTLLQAYDVERCDTSQGYTHEEVTIGNLMGR